MTAPLNNYSFNAGTGEITLTDVTTARLDHLKLIVNVTLNTIMYNFASDAVTATVATNVVTLSSVPGGANNTDKLMIFYDPQITDAAWADVTAPTDIKYIRGTAPTTAGKLDVKGADGDVFVRQATASNLNAQVSGTAASGAAVSGNPLLAGGRAATAEPTAVSDAQAVALMLTKMGKQVVVHGLRESQGHQLTTITSSTAETTIVTADASFALDLYGLIITNTSTTYTKVTIKDSTGGTTRAVISVPPQETRGFMLPSCDGHKQNAANNNWTATCGTSVADIVITAMFAKRS